jgi:hypothetical protein
MVYVKTVSDKKNDLERITEPKRERALVVAEGETKERRGKTEGRPNNLLYGCHRWGGRFFCVCVCVCICACVFVAYSIVFVFEVWHNPSVSSTDLTFSSYEDKNKRAGRDGPDCTGITWNELMNWAEMRKLLSSHTHTALSPELGAGWSPRIKNQEANAYWNRKYFVPGYHLPTYTYTHSEIYVSPKGIHHRRFADGSKNAEIH